MKKKTLWVVVTYRSLPEVLGIYQSEDMAQNMVIAHWNEKFYGEDIFDEWVDEFDRATNLLDTYGVNVLIQEMEVTA